MTRSCRPAPLYACLLLGFVVTTSALGATAPTQPGIIWPHTHSDIAPDPAARFGWLPNGMGYVIYKNSTPAKTVAVRLRIEAGTMMEAPNERGAAHFIEHMAFNGSKNIPKGDLLPLLQRHGMTLGRDTGAVTMPDKTEYILTLPSNDTESLDTALFALREMTGNQLLQPDAITHERDTILGEERARNTPLMQAGSGWRKAAFAGQKFAIYGDAIGSVDEIKTISRKALTDFYQAFYRPERTTLVIAGDIDPADIEARIKAKFSDWKPTGKSRSVVFEPYQTKGLQTFSYTAATLPDVLSASWFLPLDSKVATQTRIDQQLADLVLISILNRRLQHQAQQSDAAYIGAGMGSIPIFETAKILQLSVMPKPEQDKKAFEQTLQIFRQFVSSGVTPEEVATLLTSMENILKNTADGAATRESTAIADSIVSSLDTHDVFTSPAQDVVDFQRAKKDLVAEKLNQRLKTLFSGDGPLLAHQSEKATDLQGDVLKTAYLAAMQAPVTAYQAEATSVWPYTDFGKAQPPVSRKEFTEFGFTRYSFANGLTLNVKPTKFKTGEIMVNVGFKGGLETLSPQTDSPVFLANIYAKANLFAAGGLKKITLEQLNRALAGKTLHVTFGIGEREATFSATTTEKDLATQMQLLMAYATDAAYRPMAIDRLHALLPTLYAQQQSNPHHQLHFMVSGLVHVDDRRFSVPPLAGAQAITNEQVKNVIQTMLSVSPLEITIVGDVNPETAANAVAATFATLPTRPKEIPIAAGGDHAAFPTKNLQQVLHHSGRADQSLSMLAWPVPGETQDTQVSRGLEILTEIFRQRAFDTIRQQLGQAYDATVQRDQSWAFKDFGFIAVSGSVATGNDKAFVAAVNGIVDNLKTKPVSAEELDRARKPLLERWQKDQTDNQHWIYTLPHITDQSTPADAVYKTRDQLSAVTPAMVQALAQKYLQADKALHVEVLPQTVAAP
ncbi:MAG: insulinase family protein [Rhizomicrobium sp.]